jgi:hypothetical protein
MNDGNYDWTGLDSVRKLMTQHSAYSVSRVSSACNRRSRRSRLALAMRCVERLHGKVCMCEEN